MGSMAIVGSGQAGLLAAHALLQAGHRVTVYSDRTPDDWLTRSRPTGTAVRFERSLARVEIRCGHQLITGLELGLQCK